MDGISLTALGSLGVLAVAVVGGAWKLTRWIGQRDEALEQRMQERVKEMQQDLTGRFKSERLHADQLYARREDMSEVRSDLKYVRETLDRMWHEMQRRKRRDSDQAFPGGSQNR